MTNDPALGRLEVQIMRMIFIIYDIGRGEKMGKLQGEFRIADFLKKRDDLWLFGSVDRLSRRSDLAGHQAGESCEPSS